MKGTLADWRKMTVGGMQAQIDNLARQRDALTNQIVDMEKVVAALTPLELASKVTRKTTTSPTKATSKAGRSYKGRHWTQRPENRKKMLAVLRNASKIRHAKQRKARA